jgi:hypothetical protein
MPELKMTPKSVKEETKAEEFKVPLATNNEAARLLSK